jgi:hypothetical protein
MQRCGDLDACGFPLWPQKLKYSHAPNYHSAEIKRLKIARVNKNITTKDQVQSFKGFMFKWFALR